MKSRSPTTPINLGGRPRGPAHVARAVVMWGLGAVCHVMVIPPGARGGTNPPASGFRASWLQRSGVSDGELGHILVATPEGMGVAPAWHGCCRHALTLVIALEPLALSNNAQMLSHAWAAWA